MTYIKIVSIFLYTALLSIIALILSLIDRSFKSYFVLSKIFSAGVLWISGIKLKVSGTENLKEGQSYIYVSNHSSMFDIPAVMRAFKGRVSIVYKEELSRIPIFGWQLKTGPFISINRKNAEDAMKSIKKARETMENKKFSVILFAEGTRSKDGQIQPFKRGAFYLAAKVHLPIVPVTINGASKLLPKGKLKIKSGELSVHFSEPIEFEELKNKNDELALMDRVRNEIIKNYKGW